MSRLIEQQQKFKSDETSEIQDIKKSKKIKCENSFNLKDWMIKKVLPKNFDQKLQNKTSKLTSAVQQLSEQKDNSSTNSSYRSQQLKLRQLQQRLRQREADIETLRRSKQTCEHKYGQLYKQSSQFKKRSREALGRAVLDAAQCRRRERREVDPRLGYFRDGQTFVEGSLLKQLRRRIVQKKQLIREAQQQRRGRDADRKQRAGFRIQFLQKQIHSYTRQLQQKLTYVNVYKQRLKLGQKQAGCEYATQGWPIVFGEYQTLQLLGTGGFAQVYKVYNLKTNMTLAMKVNPVDRDSKDQRQQFVRFVNRQICALKKINHPNIIKYIELLECSQKKIIFTLEYCSGPQLSIYLKRNGCLQEKQSKQIIRQLLSALKYLAGLDQKIIHFDLKPGNLMFHHGQLKVIDFSLCKPMENQHSRIAMTSQGIGTYWYLPPQTFQENNAEISPKVDVWSAGVIFFQMLYGKKPFAHGISQSTIMEEGLILNAKKVDFPPQTPKKFKVSQGAKNFIRQCLTYNPQNRLSAAEAYQHDYFKK